jgi:UDP:flavonoid glycosyltransferase YjiC (YdhE family)
MRRLLIAWCYGGNWGHVSRQLGLARHAQRAGAEVLWAVPAERASAMEPVRQRGYRVLVSTDANPPAAAQAGAARSFADVLIGFGFGQASVLEHQVRAWLQLFQQAQPDVVAIDYAPAAQLAALLAGLPSLQLTNGFEAPPATCPPYETSVRGPYLMQRAQTQAATVSTTIGTVAGRLIPGACADLRSLIEHPHLLLNCVMESAPYGNEATWRQRAMTVMGPMGEMPDAKPPVWPPAAGDRRRVFAYLRGAHPHFETTLRGLHRRGVSTLCVWPEAPAALIEAAHENAWLRVTREPVHVADALAQADAAVGCGSGTFTTQALIAGKPQLMLPTDHEKRLVAEQVQRSALGCLVTKQMSADAVEQRLQDTIDGERFDAAAKTAAAVYRDLPAQAHDAFAERFAGATLKAA